MFPFQLISIKFFEIVKPQQYRFLSIGGADIDIYPCFGFYDFPGMLFSV